MDDATPAVMVQNDVKDDLLLITAEFSTVPIELDNAVKAAEIEFVIRPGGSPRATIALSEKGARELVERINERLKLMGKIEPDLRSDREVP